MPAGDGRKITLLDLATQTSGLPRLPDNLAPADVMNPYKDYDVADLYAFLSSYSLPRGAAPKMEAVCHVSEDALPPSCQAFVTANRAGEPLLDGT